MAWRRQPTWSARTGISRGWQPVSVKEGGVYWRDEASAIELVQKQEPVGAKRYVMGVSHLTLVDLAALKSIAELPDDKLPDPKAEHAAALMKTKGF